VLEQQLKCLLLQASQLTQVQDQTNNSTTRGECYAAMCSIFFGRNKKKYFSRGGVAYIIIIAKTTAYA
jgi:hypothetical protein